jgi:Peptidase inhibitor I78 family
MRATCLILPLSMALSACVTVDNDRPADSCQASPAQGYIGRTASSAVGSELLDLTNSRELRWVAPGMMVTMDYKFGRLTVGYDAAMRITTISCG